ALLPSAGLALVAVYVVVVPGIVAALVRHPRSRPGSLGVLATAAAAGVLVAANVVASRGTQAADLTRSGLYTLSPRSVAVAQQLDADLTVTAFFRPDQQQARHDVQTLLDLYRQQSPRVRVRFVDPDQSGGLALSLGVKTAGSVVLQYKSKPSAV